MKQNKCLALLLLLACLLMMISPVLALDDLPDLNRTGRLTVSVVGEDGSYPGGTFILYTVAHAEVHGQDYSFVYEPDFADCGLQMDNLNARELADGLAAFALENDVSGISIVLDPDEELCVDSLPLGLYLIVQDEPAKGYEPVRPFLISIPMKGQDGYIYDVDASPKMETKRTTEPTEPSTPPDTTEPDIPYTGQTWWPVPLMAVSGLLLFAVGWIVLRNGKEDYEEE